MKHDTYIRGFILCAGAILLLAGIAKLASASGTAQILDSADPIFPISFRHLMLSVGLLELAICAFCFLGRETKPTLLAVAWLASNFLLYRASLRLMGWSQPCTCLGALTDAIHIRATTANTVALALAVYLLLGSVTCLLASPQVAGRSSEHRGEAQNLASQAQPM
jgi:hypothetical protein